MKKEFSIVEHSVPMEKAYQKPSAEKWKKERYLGSGMFQLKFWNGLTKRPVLMLTIDQAHTANVQGTGKKTRTGDFIA